MSSISTFATAARHIGGQSAFYAGIGSRETPPDVLALMTKLAFRLALEGWTLRSGHAPGADQAFEIGCNGEAEIFLPWANFEHTVPVNGRRFLEPSEAAFDVAARYHPKWQYLRFGAKALHARNSHQILGADLANPVKFVICWTKSTGGTQQALRIAHDCDIPVFNLRDLADRKFAEEWLAGDI